MRACPDGAAALAFALLPVAGAQAAWPTDSGVNVAATSAPGHQADPVSAADGAGGVIVAWVEIGSNGEDDVRIQRIDGNGVPRWGPNGVVVCDASGRQEAPVLVADDAPSAARAASADAAGAFVAWTDRRNGLHTDIYAQRFDPDGTPLWAANGVPVVTAADTQLDPALLPFSSGAIVAWTDHRSPLGADVYVQRLGTDGSSLLQNDGVAVTNLSGSQFAPRLVTDDSGGFIVAWQDLRTGDVSGYNLYAQRVASTGAVQWVPEGVPICTLPTDPGSHAIAADGDGGAFLTWQDVRGAENSNLDTDIFAQHVNATGDVSWEGNGVSVVSREQLQLRPIPIADGSGGVLVVWDDYRAPTQTPDVYAQRLDATGAPQWTLDGVTIVFANDRQALAAAAADGTGGALVAWHDYRNGVHADVYAARILRDGSRPWTSNGVATSSAPETQLFAALATGGDGSAVVAWQDLRSDADFDIYAQKILPDGTLGGSVVAVPGAGPSSLIHAVVGPNPASGGAEIRFTLPADGAFSLVILDTRGAAVRGLFDGYLSEGTHTWHWQGRDDAGDDVPSGVYFVRFQSGAAIESRRLVLVR